jgi:alpha-beta hydrolase superfamily lysophospholipase
VSARPTTFFLLRGLAREAGHWGDFVDRLRVAQPGAEVHCLDAPGNGSRRDVPVPRTLEGSMEHVRRDAEVLVPAARRGPTFVFAMSMGGMIALAWAKAHGAELAGVAIANSSVSGLSPFYRRMRPGVWPRLFANFVRRDVVAREASILRMVSNDAAAREAALPGWARIIQERPNTTVSARAQLRAAMRFRAPEPPLAAPLLVLSSEGDRMVHPSCSAGIARHYGAETRIHPTAGHDLGLDAPGWLVEQLVNFARRRNGQSPAASRVAG